MAFGWRNSFKDLTKPTIFASTLSFSKMYLRNTRVDCQWPVQLSLFDLLTILSFISTSVSRRLVSETASAPDGFVCISKDAVAFLLLRSNKTTTTTTPVTIRMMITITTPATTPLFGVLLRLFPFTVVSYDGEALVEWVSEDVSGVGAGVGICGIGVGDVDGGITVGSKLSCWNIRNHPKMHQDKCRWKIQHGATFFDNQAARSN